MSPKNSTTWWITILATAALVAVFALFQVKNDGLVFSLTFAACLGVVTLEHAEQLAGKSFSIIPLKPRGKAPAMQWSEFTKRLATATEIRQWWGPEAIQPFNIGIVCGHISRIIGIDADSRAAAIQLFRRLPFTPLMSKTAKGVHFLFRLSPDQLISPRVRAVILGVLCDIRAERSFIVAPPSIHPTGKTYGWVHDLTTVDLEQVPFFDESWLDAASKSGQQNNVNKIKHPLSYIRKVFAKSGSGGHNATFRCACILRDAGLSEAESLAALVEWNQTNCVDSEGRPYLWTTQELLHKVNDAFKKGPIT